MNIYNTIFCYFTKRGRFGIDRFNGIAHVFAALLFHTLLIMEVFSLITGYQPIFLDSFHYNDQWGFMKWFVPFIIFIYLFYNETRTKKLIKEYDKIYEDDDSDNTNKMFFYILGPIIVSFLLMYLRQIKII